MARQCVVWDVDRGRKIGLIDDGASSQADHPGSSRRAGFARLWTIVAVLAVLVLFYGCCHRPSMPFWDMSTLRTQVARDYPDWTIDHVYLREGGGGVQIWEVVSAVVVLKWKGPEDFRLVVERYYGSPQQHRDGWAREDLPSLFQKRESALGFITAFNARHSESGLVVRAGGRPANTVAAIASQGPEGAIWDVSYTRASEFAASGADPTSGYLEQWRATATSDGVVWAYVGGR